MTDQNKTTLAISLMLMNYFDYRGFDVNLDYESNNLSVCNYYCGIVVAGKPSARATRQLRLHE